MRALLIVVLFLSGCALDVDAPGETPPAAESAAPELAGPAKKPPPPGSPYCAPVLNEKLELTAWYCQPPRLIDPADELGQPVELEAPSWTTGDSVPE